MNKKFTFAALLMLLTLLFQSFAAPQRAAASCSDAAQFVSDVSVQDGTIFNAGDAFTKTWKLKNVGSCTWSSSYTLIFDHGDAMGAAASVSFPNQSTAPGATINLSIPMKAPNTAGVVYGYWKLKTANGLPFGIGFNADKPFWVQIRVGSSSSSGGTNYDFAKHVVDATWTGAGVGSWIEHPQLEDGSNFTAGSGIEMLPSNATNGFVQAQYPPLTIHSGDHFQTIVDCEYQATSCHVQFRLDYQIDGGAVQNLWTFREKYEGLYARLDRDLSSLAGQDVKFILRVSADGDATGDRAMWVWPRITNAGVTQPTNTPVPTVTGTPPTPTNTPVFSTSGDRATFAADVTVPDDTVFNPNNSFDKIWKVKNTGTTTWTTSFKLVFVSGDQMNAQTEYSLNATVTPNTTYQLPTVKMTSPGANGHYKGNWMLKNASGALFGIGPASNQPFWVQIIVSGGSNATATPTLTGTPPTATATAIGTPTPNTSGDRAGFDSDITVPDGTNFTANTTFTKTWRIKNTGTSTWTTAYKLVFVSGDQLNGPNEQPLLANVAPNTKVDISVGLKAPANGGTFRGYWMLKNPSGQLFGIGSTANKPFWVDIHVPGPTATPTSGPTATPTFTPTVTKTSIPGTITLTPTPTRSPTPGTPTATSTATSISGCDRLSMDADVTIPDGEHRNATTPFTKTWRLKNIGSCTWSTAYTLVFVSGAQMGGPSTINLPSSVAPNATIDISIPLTAPTSSGNYRGYWELKNADGRPFGFGLNADTAFWVEINVVQSGGLGSTVTPTVTATSSSTPAATSTPTLTLTPAATATVTPTLSPTPTLTLTP